MNKTPFNRPVKIRPLQTDLQPDDLNALKQQNSALEDRAKRLELYIKQLAHDLKTPLTPLVGASEVLAQGCNEKPWSDLAQSIKMSAENLLRMVDELLDLERCECGQLALNCSAFDPCETVRETTDGISHRIPPGRASITTSFPSDPQLVWADEKRLSQVLKIFILNAFRFTPGGGKVGVSVVPDVIAVKFVVNDHGPFIPAEDLQHVFESKQPMHQYKPRVGGNSLVLSKRLVELQGGHIGAESHPEHGNIFWFDLPIEESQVKMGAI